MKLPGQKTTCVKIPQQELNYIPINMKQTHKTTLVREFKFTENCVQSGKQYHPGKLTRREHEIDCEIKSLFDESEILPIKKAHLTVEIIIK